MIAKKRRKTLALATMVGAAGITTVGVAFAGEVGPTGTMHVEPSSVEPGESYVISNDPASPCLLGQVSGDTGGVRPGAWFATPDSEGNWSVTIEVPESGPPDAMGNPTPFPEGAYEQHAFCEVPDTPPAEQAATAQPAAPEGQQQAEFAYDPVTLTVTAPEEQEAAPEQEEPPAAEPAAEAPTFTG